jgi:tetratricopeptide (TPR) repeat protein
MSPEQAQMSAMDVDTRTDVYALGVLLYELLTGTTPLERAKLREAGYGEILKRIREEEPPMPSIRLSESKATLQSVAAQRRTEPSRLPRLMKGDLDWIVMKSLEKDRTRRYATASGFARDIERYLHGDAVEACPPRTSYRIKKLVSKHRAALAIIGASALLLVAATTMSIALALAANRERARALHAMREAAVEAHRAEEGARQAARENRRAADAERFANEQRQLAQKREQMAIDAVKRFRDGVIEEPELKNNPALGPLRKKLLREPLSFFKSLREQLQRENELRPETLKRLSEAAIDLARAADDLGDKQDALRAIEESLSNQVHLMRNQPPPPEFQADLARTYNAFARAQLTTGRTPEARQSYERARAILERLVQENPSIGRFQSELSAAYHGIGESELKAGRHAEAMANFRRALAIRERLVSDNPTVTQFQNDLAASYNGIGVLQSETGHQAEGQAALERARAIRERLASEHGSNPKEQQ